MIHSEALQKRHGQLSPGTHRAPSVIVDRSLFLETKLFRVLSHHGTGIYIHSLFVPSPLRPFA